MVNSFALGAPLGAVNAQQAMQKQQNTQVQQQQEQQRIGLLGKQIQGQQQNLEFQQQEKLKQDTVNNVLQLTQFAAQLVSNSPSRDKVDISTIDRIRNQIKNVADMAGQKFNDPEFGNTALAKFDAIVKGTKTIDERATDTSQAAAMVKGGTAMGIYNMLKGSGLSDDQARIAAGLPSLSTGKVEAVNIPGLDNPVVVTHDSKGNVKQLNTNQQRFSYFAGVGPDPNDPTKQVQGTYRAPTNGQGVPEFIPGVVQTSKVNLSNTLPNGSLDQFSTTEKPVPNQARTDNLLFKSDSEQAKAIQGALGFIPTPAELKTVQDIASYKIPGVNMNSSFSGSAKSMETKNRLMAEVTTINPHYQAANAPALAAGLKEYTSGQTAKQIKALQTAVFHIGTYLDLAKALQNGNNTIVNSAVQAYKKITGIEAPTNFNLVKAFVSGEVTKAITNSGVAADRRIQEIEDQIKVSESFPQLAGAASTLGQLLAGQLRTQKLGFDTAITRVDPSITWDNTINLDPVVRKYYGQIISGAQEHTTGTQAPSQNSAIPKLSPEQIQQLNAELKARGLSK